MEHQGSKTLLNRIIVKLPILTISLIFFLSVSSFHQTFKSDTIDQKVVANIIRWYDLYLVLESKDYSAYPPLSTQNINILGLAGKLTLDAFEDQKFTIDENFLLVLNEVYAQALLDIFSMNPNENYKAIHKLKEEIHAKYARGSSNYTSFFKTKDEIITQIRKQIGKGKLLPYEISLCNNDINPDYSYFNAKPILPYWGNKATLIVPKAFFPLDPPYAKAKSFDQAIYQDALSVYSQSMNMSKEDLWIAEFWSDDVRGLTFSPAGRWISITNQILSQKIISTKETINLYFKLGIGLHDAAIITWMHKYNYKLQRPSTYINNHLSSEWQPLHHDPAFPSYPSGHAVLGAVAGKILENQFGRTYTFTDKSHQNRIEFLGKKRTFHSFEEASIENGYSRFLLGVHFKEDCKAGLKLGFEIGRFINQMEDSSWQNLKNTFITDHLCTN